MIFQEAPNHWCHVVLFKYVGGGELTRPASTAIITPPDTTTTTTTSTTQLEEGEQQQKGVIDTTV